MKIAILGTGMVGQALGEGLLNCGETVVFGTRDVKNTLARTENDSYGNPPFSKWLSDHSKATIGTFNDAAAASELVFNATSGSVSISALNLAGVPFLKNKIMIDVANPLDFSKGFPPSLFVSNTNSLAEQIQNEFPETYVVKTLNTVNASIMTHPDQLSESHNLFLSGNDQSSKDQVVSLLSSWFGWKTEQFIDLGDITSARSTEMLLPLWITLFGKIGHPNFNFFINIGQNRSAQ